MKGTPSSPRKPWRPGVVGATRNARAIAATLSLIFLINGYPASTVYAADRDRAAKFPSYKRCWAIIIGIDHYKHYPPGDHLVNALHDARDLYKLLTEEFTYDEDHVKLLIDTTDSGSAALKKPDTLKDVLSKWVGRNGLDKKAASEDSILFFFAGHGRESNGAGYLVTVETKKNDLESWLEVDWVKKLLADTKCKHKLIVLDCCYSAALFKFQYVSGAQEPFAADLPQNPVRFFLHQTAFFGLTAGRYGPVSDKSSQGKNSNFTAALLRQMRERCDTDFRAHAFTAGLLGEKIANQVTADPEAVQAPAVGRLSKGAGEFLFFPRQPDKRETQSERKIRLEVKRLVEVGTQRAFVDAGVLRSYQGQLFGVLPYFARACQMVKEAQRPSEGDSLRFKTALKQCPVLLNLWSEPRGIEHAQFNPDGDIIITVDKKGTIRSRRRTDGELVGKEMENGCRIREEFSAITFSYDGRRLACASEDGIAHVWDPRVGRELFKLKHPGVKVVRFSRDCSRLLTVADSEALCWNVGDGQRVGRPLSHRPVALVTAEFSKNGKQVVTVAVDGEVRVWNAEGERAFTERVFHKGAAWATFRDDDLVLVTVGADGFVRFWDPEDGTTGGKTIELGHGLLQAEFTGKGAVLVVRDNRHKEHIFVEEQGPVAPSPHPAVFLESPKVQRASTGPPVRPAGPDVRYKKSSRRHVAARAAVHPHRTIDGRYDIEVYAGLARLWDLSTERMPAATFQHVGNKELSWSLLENLCSAEVSFASGVDGLGKLLLGPGGVRLVSFDPHNEVSWSLRTGKQAPREAGRNVQIYDIWDIGNDGRHALVADGKTIRVIDLKSGLERGRQFRQPAEAQTCEISRDATRAMVGDNKGAFRFFDLQLGRQLGPVWRPIDKVKEAAQSDPTEERFVKLNPGGRYAFANNAQSLEVWDVAAGQPISIAPQECNYGGFSDDEEYFLAVANNGTFLFERAKGQGRQWVQKWVKDDLSIRWMTFSCDGSKVAFGTDDGKIEILLTSSGEPVAVPFLGGGDKADPLDLAGPGEVDRLEFSGDGRLLATRSRVYEGDPDAGWAQVWDARTGEPLTPPLWHSKLSWVRFSPDSRWLVTASEDEVLKYWELSPPEDVFQSLDFNRQISRLLSGLELPGARGPGSPVLALESAKLENLWKDWKSAYKAACKPSQLQELSWYTMAANDCVATQDWARAIRQYDRLIELEPEQWRWFWWRGYAHGCLANHKAALADYEAALRLEPSNEKLRKNQQSALETLRGSGSPEIGKK